MCESPSLDNRGGVYVPALERRAWARMTERMMKVFIVKFWGGGGKETVGENVRRLRSVRGPGGAGG